MDTTTEHGGGEVDREYALRQATDPYLDPSVRDYWARLASRPAQPAAPDPSADGGGGGGIEAALNEFADAISTRCANPRGDNNKWRKAKRRVANARAAVLALASRPPALGATGVAFSAETKGQESIMGFSGFGIAQTAEESSVDAIDPDEDAWMEPVFAEAQSIADSPAVLSVYAAPEWAELSQDGQQWVRALISETLARARTPALGAAGVAEEELASIICHTSFHREAGRQDEARLPVADYDRLIAAARRPEGQEEKS